MEGEQNKAAKARLFAPYNLKFIDLFCGIGGFRLALESLGGECVFSSEINLQAVKVYAENFHDTPHGDITKISSEEIPAHDILCAGFPCQPFSRGGLQKGFDDKRGQLIFEVVRILSDKKPSAFILENVKGLALLDGGKQTVLRVHDILEQKLQNEYLWITQGELNCIENHSARHTAKSNKWGICFKQGRRHCKYACCERWGTEKQFTC